jgi:hypothetical protein
MPQNPPEPSPTPIRPQPGDPCKLPRPSPLLLFRNLCFYYWLVQVMGRWLGLKMVRGETITLHFHLNIPTAISNQLTTRIHIHKVFHNISSTPAVASLFRHVRLSPLLSVELSASAQATATWRSYLPPLDECTSIIQVSLILRWGKGVANMIFMASGVSRCGTASEWWLAGKAYFTSIHIILLQVFYPVDDTSEYFWWRETSQIVPCIYLANPTFFLPKPSLYFYINLLETQIFFQFLSLMSSSATLTFNIERVFESCFSLSYNIIHI